MEFESHEQRTARVLSRFSVFDLREQSATELETAETLLIASEKQIEIIESGIAPNLIEWFVIHSGENIYQVRKFENFCFCSCASFFFGSIACKHISITFEAMCVKCKRRRPEKRGGKCSGCEIADSPYFSPLVEKPPEKLGNIRI